MVNKWLVWIQHMASASQYPKQTSYTFTWHLVIPHFIIFLHGSPLALHQTKFLDLHFDCRMLGNSCDISESFISWLDYGVRCIHLLWIFFPSLKLSIIKDCVGTFSLSPFKRLLIVTCSFITKQLKFLVYIILTFNLHNPAICRFFFLWYLAALLILSSFSVHSVHFLSIPSWEVLIFHVPYTKSHISLPQTCAPSWIFLHWVCMLLLCTLMVLSSDGVENGSSLTTELFWLFWSSGQGTFRLFCTFCSSEPINFLQRDLPSSKYFLVLSLSIHDWWHKYWSKLE